MPSVRATKLNDDFPGHRCDEGHDADRPDVCTLLNVSVSGFYGWKNRKPSRRQRNDMVLLAHIRAQFATSNETYGAHRACMLNSRKRD